MSDPLVIPPSIQDLFLADHEKFDILSRRALAAFAAGAEEAGRNLWSELIAALTMHLDAEERFMIPPLARARPVEARAILAEHRLIRDRLSEIGADVGRRAVRLDVVRAFADELQAHACHEARIFYAWSDVWLNDRERALLFAYRDASNASSTASSSSSLTGFVR